MRLAYQSDIENLVALYTEAATYAGEVGHIDWENPFSVQVVKKFIEEKELFCVDGENDLPAAAVRLTTEGDNRIWQPNEISAHLYISKLATANSVHGTGYTSSVVLPNIVTRASEAECDGIRLDCLADNPGLIRFYSRLGFSALGIRSFYSDKQQRPLTVMCFEQLI
jgi:ribosomal protein S18 acetylase RimI-like enzyme